jgi:hypothetical protein
MINSNFGFTPLKEVWLGDCYPESFYDHLPNEISDPFRQITEWTKQDTGRLQKFLEQQGIVVRRPTFDSIDDYINDQGVLTKPPITPRDHYLVLGNTLYSLDNKLSKDPWHHVMDQYQQQGFDVQSPKDLPINCVSPPSLVRMGRDLYLDTHTHMDAWGYLCEWMVNTSVDYRVNICLTYGHSDAVFCPIAPGIIASSHYKSNYDQSFPGWEVFKIPNRLNNFRYGSETPKNFYCATPQIDNNRAFNQYIIDYAKNWVGDFKETVYEVNMLVLDEKNVVAMKEYPTLTKWLEDKGITVHYFDFRCRSFWDGGWHCLTLDIHREDSKTDLFPERGENGVYWRLK